MRRSGPFPWFALALVGCGTGASSDPALDADLRIERAQFVTGAPPPDDGGPKVESVEIAALTVWPGETNKPIQGALAATATAAAVDLAEDRGYWVIVAGVPDVSAPDLPTFRAVATFSSALAPGARTLEIRAVDAAGRFGPAVTRTLTDLDHPPADSPPMGALVVSLTWDTEADLDLHVVDPLGNEIFHGARSSAAEASSGPGTLDLDSNAGCVIDGRRQENVVWVSAPPVGSYAVLVDTPSLCGQAIAHWRVGATLNGSSLGRAAGVSLDSDTWGAHDRGAGVVALTFDVP